MDRATRTETSRRHERQAQNGKGRSLHIGSKQAQEAAAKVLPVYSYFEQFRAAPRQDIDAPCISQHPVSICAATSAHGDEMSKPNGELFRNFQIATKWLELELVSSSPVYDDYEIVELTARSPTWRHDSTE